jgi:hypothetical protein
MIKKLFSFHTELLGFWIFSIVQKPSNSVCYAPSSEPFRIFFLFCRYLFLSAIRVGSSYEQE